MEDEVTQLEDQQPGAEPEVQDEPEAGGQQQQADAVDKPSKRERRAAWVAEKQREREELARNFERERAQREDLARQLAELRGQLSAREQQTSQQSEEQAFEAKLKTMQDEANAHLEAAANTQDPNIRQREMAAYNKMVMRDIPQTIARRERELTLGEVRQTLSQNQLDPQTAETRDALAAEFRWLRTNASARSVADAFLGEMLQSGKPDSLETYRAACARAAQVMGLGGEPGKGNGESRRFSLPSGKLGSAGGGDSNVDKPLTDHEVVMANKLASVKGLTFNDEGERDRWFRKTVLSKVQKTA